MSTLRQCCKYLGIAVLCLAAAGVQAKRIALVMGNDNYQFVAKLQKAGNDAEAMARELRAAGFEVLLHRDLKYAAMVHAVDTLTRRTVGGDQVVVFFAGHGVQIKSGSYLLPVDINASSEAVVDKTAYGLNDLMDQLAQAKAGFSLVIVDACRDNPLKSAGRSIGATRGLTPPDPPKGQMVVYSASKGQQALDRLNDNDANPNGVFTREFIERMRRPGLRVEDLVRQVQDSVEKLASSVSHEQRPALYNEARGRFSFYPQAASQPGSAPGSVAATAPARPDPDLALWDAVKGSSRAQDFQDYLDAFPAGVYAPVARVRLRQLKAEAAPMVATLPASRAAAAATTPLAVPQLASASRPASQTPLPANRPASAAMASAASATAVARPPASANVLQASPSSFPKGTVPVSADALNRMLPGKVFKLKFLNGQTLRVEFNKNGYVFNNWSNGSTDSGKWQAEDGKVCVQYTRSRPGCHDYRLLGEQLWVRYGTGNDVVPAVSE